MIWTDVFQCVIMFGGMLAVIIQVIKSIVRCFINQFNERTILKILIHKDSIQKDHSK